MLFSSWVEALGYSFSRQIGRFFSNGTNKIESDNSSLHIFLDTCSKLKFSNMIHIKACGILVAMGASLSACSNAVS